MKFPVDETLGKNVVIIKIPSHLNENIAEEFKLFLRQLVEKEKYKIVLDLSETKYIDSSGLGAMVSKIAECRAHGGDIRLVHNSEFITKLLIITHLNEVLKVYHNIQEAVASFE